jgi:hypothetical protein
MNARLALLILLATTSTSAVQAAAMPMSQAHAQKTRYLGPPALPLTAAVVAAGGGVSHFDSLRLLAVLTGPHETNEVATLTRRFGKARVGAFVVTFNHAVDDALTVATKAGVTLPPVPAYLQIGPNLAARLFAAGTMADGRYDVGYMLEHLISRNIHVAIMHELDADPAVGPARNADFHIILTSLMGDLKTQYGL